MPSHYIDKHHRKIPKANCESPSMVVNAINIIDEAIRKMMVG